MGWQQCDFLIKKRFQEKYRSIGEPLNENKLPLLSTKKAVHQKNPRLQFSRMAILLFHGYTSLTNHEMTIQKTFPSMLINLRTYHWPNWMPGAQEQSQTSQSISSLCLILLKQRCTLDAAILHGVVLFQMLSPGKSIALKGKLTPCSSPTWCSRSTDSLKVSLMVKFGTGTRQKVLPSSQIPNNWQGPSCWWEKWVVPTTCWTT